MNDYEEYERNGLTVTIHNDDDPMDPRENDNVGTMICSHRNYKLGDEQFNSDDYESWADLKNYLINERKAVIVLSLGLYDHSGITMYVGDSHDRWDGGQVGFIYCTQEDINREWAGDAKHAEEYLRGEVKEYDQYLTGDVYGFTVTNPKNGEDIESSWGYFGIEYARETANECADYFVHPHDAAYAKHATIIHG